MKFFTIATISMVASIAVADCIPSAICPGPNSKGPDLCDWTCKRQGNPAGGRCQKRDGCAGLLGICACYPRPKSVKQREIDAPVEKRAPDPEPEVKDMIIADGQFIEAENHVKRTLDVRSVCCSFGDAKAINIGNACCEGHCDLIGKNGGQCSSENICTCNK